MYTVVRVVHTILLLRIDSLVDAPPANVTLCGRQEAFPAIFLAVKGRLLVVDCAGPGLAVPGGRDAVLYAVLFWDDGAHLSTEATRYDGGARAKRQRHRKMRKRDETKARASLPSVFLERLQMAGAAA